MISSISYGQFSVGVGPSLYKNFGAPRSIVGFHVQGELCEDDETSFHGRVSVTPFAKEDPVNLYLSDFNGNQFAVSHDYIPKTNYISIKGGYKTYIGDGYEFGFAAYGGTSLGAIISSVRLDAGDYDRTQYLVPEQLKETGRVFGLVAGLNGGVKYSLPPAGTIYLDAGLDYILLPLNNQKQALNYTSFLRNSLFFSVELGFRRDILW